MGSFKEMLLKLLELGQDDLKGQNKSKKSTVCQSRRCHGWVTCKRKQSKLKTYPNLKINQHTSINSWIPSFVIPFYAVSELSVDSQISVSSITAMTVTRTQDLNNWTRVQLLDYVDVCATNTLAFSWVCVTKMIMLVVFKLHPKLRDIF